MLPNKKSKMKKFVVFFLVVLSIHFQASAQQKIDVEKALSNAAAHYRNQVALFADSTKSPRSINYDGSIKSIKSNDWCSGFFGGSLWLLYQNDKDVFWKNAAQKWTKAVEKEQFNTGTHDLGFMMFCTFGNGYALTSDSNYKRVIVQSAKSLATRFKPSAGVIRSWDHGPYGFPVIIDNMMNLELLFEASKYSGDNRYSQIAIKHANNTIIHHFRSDFSSYHVIDYDTATGMPNRRITNQGYSDESAWARGQAWGLYGYTVMYRYTKNPLYLNQARKIAEFIVKHPNMPKDKVPYWDFNDPAIPETYRDASAGAIVASALLELKNFVNVKESQYYFNTAETILTSLASPAYTAVAGTNKNFIIKHCVGNMPRGRETGEVDTSINYAEYYYIEALLRYKAAMQATMKTK
jgi:hypothetical protein